MQSLTISLRLDQALSVLALFVPIRSRDFDSLGDPAVGDTTKPGHRFENLFITSAIFMYTRKETTQAHTAGSTMFFSSLMASSLAQNLTPSRIASALVFFPGVTRLSNSFISTNLHSTAKMASFTLLALIWLHGAGVRPVRAHSLTPYGALILVAFAASI